MHYPDNNSLGNNHLSNIKKQLSEIEKILCEIIRNELILDIQLNIQDRLHFNLGADSINTMNIFAAIESRFDIILPLEAFSEETTIKFLAMHVERACNAVDEKTSANTSIKTDIKRKQLAYIAAWSGSKVRQEALIVSLNTAGQLPPLFWCFQGNIEHEQLAMNLSPDRPLHGMRSGHLIFEYTEENVNALASLYVEEMITMQPEGEFRLGGNCQGGTIARTIALQLIARGRKVSLLILMEQRHLLQWAAPVVLIFGAESDYNPYLKITNPDVLFRATYPAGYTVEIISGKHGHFFEADKIKSLATAITRHLLKADAARKI